MCDILESSICSSSIELYLSAAQSVTADRALTAMCQCQWIDGGDGDGQFARRFQKLGFIGG